MSTRLLLRIVKYDVTNMYYKYYKNPNQRVGLVQIGPHHHLIEN